MSLATLWDNLSNFLGDFFQTMTNVWQWLLTPIKFGNVITIAPIFLMSGSALIAWLVYVIAREVIV